MTPEEWWNQGYRFMIFLWWCVFLLMIGLFWLGYKKSVGSENLTDINLLRKRFDKGELTKEEYYFLSRRLKRR